jgi:hypothetical protein
MTDIQNAPAVEQVAVTQAVRDAVAEFELMIGRINPMDADNIRAGEWDATRDVQWFARLLSTRHPAATGSVRECAASPDHADIMETIENASDDWQKQGYTSALAEVRDMANVGRSLMEALPNGYHYMDSPAEIVTDLQTKLDEALATQPEATGNDGAGQEATLEMRQAALDASRQSDPPFLPVGRELWAAQECWSVMFAAQTADAHTPTREGDRDA